MSSMKHTPAGIAERLLPERLSYLLADRPLLWCESAEEYDALFSDIFSELDPKGVIETLLVKDIVDYFWEIKRMRSLKVAALHAELPAAAGTLLTKSYFPALGLESAQSMKPLVFAAISGLKVQADALQSEMSGAHVTPQMMQYQALKSGLTAISAIDVSITRLERRRDQLLKQISERRAAFKAMAKQLIEHDGATVINSGPGQSN